MKEEKKTKVDNQQFDPEVLRAMINGGENQEGMVTVEPEDEIDPRTKEALFTEIEPKNQVKPGKVKKKLGKYVEKFLFDMKKNPEKYQIMTPRGMMAIDQAIQQGYDPATKDFTDKGSKAEFEESLGQLSESGRESIKRITSPGNIQMPVATAEGMGIDAENPMVAGMGPAEGAPVEAGPEGAPQEIDPALLAALGGGQ